MIILLFEPRGNRGNIIPPSDLYYFISSTEADFKQQFFFLADEIIWLRNINVTFLTNFSFNRCIIWCFFFSSRSHLIVLFRFICFYFYIHRLFLLYFITIFILAYFTPISILPLVFLFSHYTRMIILLHIQLI